MGNPFKIISTNVSDAGKPITFLDHALTEAMRITPFVIMISDNGRRNVARGARRDFQQNNQSTERSDVKIGNHFQQTRNQGNYKELTPRVRPQL